MVSDPRVFEVHDPLVFDVPDTVAFDFPDPLAFDVPDPVAFDVPDPLNKSMVFLYVSVGVSVELECKIGGCDLTGDK